ncbi:hypothetical protein Tco_1252713 [Tanacetum coccineum]
MMINSGLIKALMPIDGYTQSVQKHIREAELHSLYLMMGHAGNIVAIRGFADSKVAIEPSDLVDMAALMKGLCLINCADSFVEISVSARGTDIAKITRKRSVGSLCLMDLNL